MLRTTHCWQRYLCAQLNRPMPWVRGSFVPRVQLHTCIHPKEGWDEGGGRDMHITIDCLLFCCCCCCCCCRCTLYLSVCSGVQYTCSCHISSYFLIFLFQFILTPGPPDELPVKVPPLLAALRSTRYVHVKEMYIWDIPMKHEDVATMVIFV